MANIVGSGANDTLFGTEEADNVWGLAGDDILDGIGGNDALYGGAGNDVLTSSSGYDRLDGGEGDDRLVLNGKGGAVTGGAGFDTFVINLSAVSAAVTLNGTAGHGVFGTASEDQFFFSNIERLELTTGDGNDRILGTTNDDVISTRGGDDIIGSYSGTDTLGDDYIHAGDGFDLIIDMNGANRLFGGSSDDVVETTLASAELDGGSGTGDRLYLYDEWRTEDVTVDFAQGTSSTGTLIRGFESVNIELGSGNDTIIATNLFTSTLRGGEGNNHIEGGNGQDYMVSGHGDDVMNGGGGQDSIISLGGTDFLNGGDGNDAISDGSEAAMDGFTTIDAGAGADAIRIYFPDGSVDGGEGNDTLTIQCQPTLDAMNFDAAAGTLGTNLTFVNVENFRVESGEGNDTLRSGGGNDYLASSSGDDLLDSGAGNDELWGGQGSDRMIGGDGADTFRYWSDTFLGAGIDHIEDFDTDSGDVLRFLNTEFTTGITDFTSFLAASTQTAEGVYVAFNGSPTYGILLENTVLSDFSSNDLSFV